MRDADPTSDRGAKGETDGADDADHGLQWPTSQALPTFATPDRLDVVEVDGDVSAELELLLTTLQGAINRSRPRLYLVVGDVAEGEYTWPRDLDVPYRIRDPDEVLDGYLDDVGDLVVYDPSLPATVNVATTLAGVHGAAVAAPDLADSLTDRFDVSVVEDLRGRFESAVDAYRWQYEEHWTETTNRALVGLPPVGEDGDVFAEFRDYAVATRSTTVWLDVNDPDERALFEALLGDLDTDAGYLGWFAEDVAGEFEGVEVCSQHSVYVGPTDFCNNLTVFSGVEGADGDGRDGRPTASESESTPALEDKVYVTLTFTEGDNLQYDQHRMRELWDDAKRGAVPINWSLSPLLADAAPTMLDFYHRTATHNDHLMCGPSGSGYIYPTPWPDDTFEQFTQRTARDMDRAGLDTMYLLNRTDGEDVPLGASEIDAYVRDVDPLGVVLNFWPGRETETEIQRGLPVAVGPFVDSADDLVTTIEEHAADWTPEDGPTFLALGLLAWDMTPTDVAAAVDRLGEEYEVVRGDHFFELAREATR